MNEIDDFDTSTEKNVVEVELENCDVHIPLASNSYPGIASFDSKDFTVDVGTGHVKSKMKYGTPQYLGFVKENVDYNGSSALSWSLNSNSVKPIDKVEVGDIIMLTQVYDKFTPGSLFKIIAVTDVVLTDLEVLVVFACNFDSSYIVQETGNSEDKVMSQKAATENFAHLIDGKVPASQLPSYVDDVLEYNTKSDFPKTGEEGKIYVDKETNYTYRWSSSTYIMVGGEDLNLENGKGENSVQQKGTTASYDNMATFGKFNKNSPDNIFEIGCGTDINNRNNAFEVLKDGRAKVQSAPVDDDDVVRLLELDKKLDKSSIVQTMGQATDKTMSQKAITYEFLNIPQVVEKVTGKNIFNKNNIKDTGFYIQYTTGNLVASSTYCVTDYDFIKESTNYYAQNTGGGFQVCFYDKLKNYISGAIINSGYGTFTTPSDCVYYRCSVMIDKLDIVMIAEGTTTSTYEEYKFFGYILKNSALFRNVKIVTKTGEYGYRTVSAAVADSVDGDIIFVKNGTYDDEIILARDKEITIIGENKNKVIIQNITNSYQTPPLEMSKGKIKNLTLYAKDTGNESTHSSGWLAYGMHIDFDGLIDNTLIVENCVIKSDKNCAVGIGLRKGGVLSFENCAFESRDSSAIFFHDNANANNAGIQTLSIKNCVAVSSGTLGTVMRVDSQCIEGTTVNVTFINNVFISNTVETAVINTINQSTGTATTVGNFKGLINFYKTKLCYGNNLSDLNY